MLYTVVLGLLLLVKQESSWGIIIDKISSLLVILSIWLFLLFFFIIGRYKKKNFFQYNITISFIFIVVCFTFFIKNIFFLLCVFWGFFNSSYVSNFWLGLSGRACSGSFLFICLYHCWLFAPSFSVYYIQRNIRVVFGIMTYFFCKTLWWAFLLSIFFCLFWFTY